MKLYDCEIDLDETESLVQGNQPNNRSPSSSHATTTTAKAPMSGNNCTLKIKVILTIIFIFSSVMLWDGSLINEVEEDGVSAREAEKTFYSSTKTEANPGIDTNDVNITMGDGSAEDAEDNKNNVEDSLLNQGEEDVVSTGQVTENSDIFDAAEDTVAKSIIISDEGVDEENYDNENVVIEFDSTKKSQIENYKAGSALMFNVHITHHAGTAMCFAMSKWGPTPSFACVGEQNKTLPSSDVLNTASKALPWKYNDAEKHVNSIRRYYHMYSHEFMTHPKKPLHSMNWKYQNLLSVYISRDPIDRLLSGDGFLNKAFGGEKDRTEEQWHGFAKSWQANNYALDVLTKKKCVNGKNTTIKCLESAKDLLKRFTFILDQACLTEGLERMAQLLGKPIPILKDGSVRSAKATAKERIPYVDVYDNLVEQNKMSIALYEWSKSISLVKCEEKKIRL